MLEITNVINISVAQAPIGLGNYNVNNLALFSNEIPINAEILNSYGVYISPAAVADDWGTASETYAQAVKIFSQSPNILNGGGRLIVFPILQGIISTVSVTAAGSGYEIGDVLTVVESGATGGTVTVATVGGSGEVTGVTLTTGGQDYTTGAGKTTTGGTGTGATINITAITAEELLDAFNRVKDLIFFVGIISTFLPSTDEDLQDFSDAIQAEPLKMWILSQHTTAAIAGIFTDIKDASNNHTRCFLYTESGDAEGARLAAAAYAGKGFSTNFQGSNTAQTMNLKPLTTIDPDENITQTIYTQAEAAGVDLYVSYAGIPSVVSNGANGYFDSVYGLLWFVSQLQVNGFNALRSVATKIPQTEPGMSLLKAAYRLACQQAVANGYVAPGTWTSPERFGNPEDMLANIEQRGFYIYSQPISQQDAQDRADRIAPLVQIAIKEAGAIQSSTVIVNVNQ